MAKEHISVINEHVVEIRFRPDPTILDRRGQLAKEISSELNFSEWLIIENRVDVYTADGREHAFVGFRNAGFVATDTPTKDQFPDRAAKLLRLLMSVRGVGDNLIIDRIGARSKFLTSYSGSFDQLLSKYTEKYVRPTESASSAYGHTSKLIDIGAPLNFVDELGNYNTHCGPMLPQQATEFFRRKEGFPLVGFFFDIDYFLRPAKAVRGSDVVTTVNGFCKRAWERNEAVTSLVLGQK